LIALFEIQNQIRKKDYTFSRSGIVVISDGLKKKYVSALTDILEQNRSYKAQSGIRRDNSLQRMQEITTIKQKCIELKKYLREANLIQPRIKK
jgi:hypothetical protein